MSKLSFILIIIFSSKLFASAINLEIEYQEANGGKKVSQKQSVQLPNTLFDEPSVSQPAMHKTLFAVRLCNLIKSSLVDYQASLRNFRDIRPCPMPEPGCWHDRRKEHALALSYNLGKLQSTLSSAFADSDVLDAIELVKKLSDNMLKGEFGPVFDRFESAPTCHAKMASSAGLNVTAGGVKDYSHFQKQVEDGYVPVPEAFIEEGFISSFNLALETDNCNGLICLNPAYAFDKEKLFIQVGMNSNVTAESFKRPSVNLCFVIDISGSMSATDYTERSRLEWAKEAVYQALSHLNEDDTVSIVLFDSVSQVLISPTAVSNRSAIIKQLQKIQTGNSTNLDAGLRDGFQLISKSFKEGCENRVILLSDAGLNTGVIDHTTILRLVSDYAAENIGLTAIGVGENFHHDFIHKITMSKGGNALFVHTGADMMKFFKNFDYLVTPIAYNLKIAAEPVNLNAKLAKAYGVPMQKDEPVHELVNVRTLFFSEESGGAIILEYDLSRRK